LEICRDIAPLHPSTRATIYSGDVGNKKRRSTSYHERLGQVHGYFNATGDDRTRLRKNPSRTVQKELAI
jgi:hypothetical protein